MLKRDAIPSQATDDDQPTITRDEVDLNNYGRSGFLEAQQEQTRNNKRYEHVTEKIIQWQQRLSVTNFRH